MGRVEFKLEGHRIHLAVEGSTGGTTLALHLAADTIQAGRRVLWASVEMPDPSRFSQLFSHLSLVESSRFHAMNFGGRFDRAMDALLEAATSLPSVGLVVLDDWCSTTGRIDADRIRHVKNFSEACSSTINVLLISKGSADASGSTREPIVARGKEKMEDAGFETWRLWRNEGNRRTIDQNGTLAELNIEDSGFVV